MNIAEKLKKSLNENWSMRFKTKHPDGDSYDGVVIHIGDDFFAMRAEDSFEMDGIQIFPNSAIKGYRDKKYERCANEIMKANGEINRASPPEWLNDCNSMRDVIAQMMERDIWPAIENTFDDDTSAFYLGKITKIKKNHFYLKGYDAAGKWKKEFKLRFDEIFRIEFDSKYCNNFNSYMRNRE